MDSKLKKAAMKKARKEGWTLSAVLNLATKAFVDNRIGLAELDPNIAKSLSEIERGEVYTLDEVKKMIVEQRKLSAN